MNAILCADQNWAIGRDNQLLFHISGDMKRFRALTTGGAVLMGRKTLDSFPGGRPLPDRRNIVITRNRDFVRAGVDVAHSLSQALALAGPDSGSLWLIGGGSIYAALLDRCRQVCLTQVDAAAEGADTFFPNLDKLPRWERCAVSQDFQENGLTYRFIDYRNTALD